MLTGKLSHTELVSLMDHALWWGQNFAEELSRGIAEDEEEERQRRELLAAMYVYGACARQEGKFAPCKGLREVGEEFVEVDFNEEAVAFLVDLRAELRSDLESRRGGVEINDKGPEDVFVLFILDGLIEGGKRG